MNKKIELSKEKQVHMISMTEDYFSKDRDEELGDLAAMLILDFFMEKLAPEIYNQGVYDSYKYFSEKIEDLLEIQKY